MWFSELRPGLEKWASSEKQARVWKICDSQNLQNPKFLSWERTDSLEHLETLGEFGEHGPEAGLSLERLQHEFGRLFENMGLSL